MDKRRKRGKGGKGSLLAWVILHVLVNFYAFMVVREFFFLFYILSFAQGVDECSYDGKDSYITTYIHYIHDMIYHEYLGYPQ